MTLSDSGRAIGAVSKLLREHLIRNGFAVTVGKPEVAAAVDGTAKVNLFLYQADFDPSLRNYSLQADQPAPLWLSLKYLLTAFDTTESSDSPEAHELLGRGLSTLQQLNFISLDAGVAGDVRLALENSPEPLKITFEETSADLLSKLSQGTDEKYRFSVAFEVRPVMIAAGTPDSFPLAVGIDYTQAPPAVIGKAGIGLAVLASLGPRLESVEPTSFEPGASITIHGEDLNLSGLECMLDSVPLSSTAQRPDRLTVRVEGSGGPPGPIAAGGAISAGEHTLSVRQLMPNGRYRVSNLLVGRLLPVVTSAVVVAGELRVNGSLLGTWNDDLLVGLQQGGRVTRLLEAGPQPPPPPAALTVVPSANQTRLSIAGVGALVPGDYQVVVRVNGQQARMSPSITLP